ncbi:MAG: glycosyltransferase family 4 protein [Candidatus Aminicenantales bacterium]
MAIENGLRIGIIAHRFECPGGIQTIFLELIEGLNDAGVVPDVVWDEPQDWSTLGNPDVRTTFGGGKLGISSKTLRSLPPRLAGRLRPWSVRHARLRLGQYDFVYCFEPGVKMPKGVPNLCWIAGPRYLRLPGDRVDQRRFWKPREIKMTVNHLVQPLVRPDKYYSYVTHSEYIAEMIQERLGFKPPLIWPPARSRTLPAAEADRAGFLFLSRFEEFKRADTVLNLAKAFPEQPFTLAGAAIGEDHEYLDRLRRRIVAEGLKNATIVENPSEAQVAGLLTSHAVFVFPVHGEHFGIVTVEAVQAGLLPLVHDSGGQREIVPNKSLRFTSDEDLIERARCALRMSPGERSGLIKDLQRHTERGTPRRFREIMLQRIRDVPALKDRLGRPAGGD